MSPGMKFDLNSGSSHDMSSNFAQAMPKLVNRRGGMIMPTAGTLRRYSDSGKAILLVTLSLSGIIRRNDIVRGGANFRNDNSLQA